MNLLFVNGVTCLCVATSAVTIASVLRFEIWYCIWRITPPGSNGNDPSAGRDPTDFSSAVPFPEPTNATFPFAVGSVSEKMTLLWASLTALSSAMSSFCPRVLGSESWTSTAIAAGCCAEIVLIALPSTVRGNGNCLLRSWNDFGSIATTIRFLGTACVPRTVKRVLIVLPSSDCKRLAP